MRPLFAGPSAPRPPRPAGSPSSSASSGQSDGVPHERERSPRTPLPVPVPMPAPALVPVHQPPRTPMMDARRYRNLFPRRRIAPPTPPPSDDEPSDDGDGDDQEDSQTASDASLSSRDVSSAGASYGSERERTSFNSRPSDRFSSGSSSSGSSFGSGSISGGSVSDASSDDDLVNRYFAGTFPPSMPLFLLFSCSASSTFSNRFTHSRNRCHWHNNRRTERYRRKEYNTKGHPTEMDSTPARVPKRIHLD
ncbi:hypothetical protein PIB30_044683 [Stylosanthes scabra]|uniref:Uncharacterized protein n=1 Tax=Stylosanthes scabra TaxID=79078 RepID=A0ABU6RGH9_9FABA|nr:hypothetical protein [Stylosanthes scabra]